MRTSLRVLAVLTGAAVALPAAPALAAGGPGPSITPATVVSGVVTKNGVPVVGAEVRAQAWPSTEVLSNLPGGAHFNVQILAQEPTDAKGRFAITVDPVSIRKGYVAPDGSVQIALIVADEQQQVRWQFTATRAANGASGLWANPRIAPNVLAQRGSAHQAPTRLAIDMGGNASVIEEANEPERWLGDDGQPLGPQRGLQAAKVTREPRTLTRQTAGGLSPDASECFYTETNEYQYGRSEKFVRAIGSGYANVTVDQEIGTSHTMGIGIKSGSASWTQSGTSTLSFGASSVINYGANGKVIYNKVNYRKAVETCPGLVIYYWNPIGYYALNALWGPITSPYWSACTTYYTGTQTKTSGSNITFATGVDLDVIDLSSQASFSTVTRLSWTFTGTARLCGSAASGWVSSPEAGAYS